MHTLDDSCLQGSYWLGSYLFMHFSSYALRSNNISLLLVCELKQERKLSVSMPPLHGMISNFIWNCQNLFHWKLSALFKKTTTMEILRTVPVFSILNFLFVTGTVTSVTACSLYSMGHRCYFISFNLDLWNFFSHTTWLVFDR